MEQPPADQAELSRREFLRRAAMATMATAVASGAYVLEGHGAPAATLETIPPLDVHEAVAGIAATRSRLVAVGGVSMETAARPAVWIYRFGDHSWLRTPASGLPAGTALSAITTLGSAFLAAGHVQRVNRTHPVIDDQTGRRTAFPVFEYVPAVFRSPNGRTWTQVVSGVPAARWGSFAAITTGADGALAVGSRFLEPGVTEGYGLIAMASRDGRSWDEAALSGVAPPVHGGVTLLARVGARTLLGINALRTTALYESSGRRWRAVPVPSPDVTYVAASGTEAAFLLAGVDASAEPRFWQRTADGWRERPDLSASLRGAWVADFESVDGSFVAAGSRQGHGFVTSFGG
jgi:hypothetical protein